MSEGRSRALLRLLRVPPEPRLPAGDPGSARVFRAGANFWNLKLLGWALQHAMALAGFVFAMVTLHTAAREVPHLGVFRLVEMVVFAVWLAFVPVTLAILRLDYELRWYIVTDRAARLREGILNLREMTFTLANVQDIRIQQGPLQRLLGLADVELRTAGGGDEAAARGGRAGGESRNLHIARFRGVEDAQAIRDLVVDRMKKARGAGLGDPDDAPRRCAFRGASSKPRPPSWRRSRACCGRPSPRGRAARPAFSAAKRLLSQRGAIHSRRAAR